MVARDALESLRSIEAVIFDCDGVLVDTRGSYDKAIVLTVDQLLSRMLHVEFLGKPVGTEEIRLLRGTGGFNNDAYTAYILTLWLFINLPEDVLLGLREVFSKIRELRVRQRPDELFQQISKDALSTHGYLPIIIEEIQYSIPEVVGMSRQGSSNITTSDMIEQRLADIAAQRGFLDVYRIFKDILGMPGEYGSGLIETIFSDLYYGENVVSRIHGDGPYFKFGEGLYTNERVFISEDTLKHLTSRLGRTYISIVTGRDRMVSEIVLGELVEYFNMNASVFIADELKKGVSDKIEKPSPYGLIKSASLMGPVTKVAYVGNSVEDIMMARNAAQFGLKTLFIGVTGLSPSPALDRDLFISMGADAIIEKPDALLDILGEVKRKF